MNLGEEKPTKQCDEAMLERGYGPVGRVLVRDAGSLGFGSQHCIELSFVAVTSNPSTWETEIGKLEVQSHPWLLWEHMGSLSYMRLCLKRISKQSFLALSWGK